MGKKVGIKRECFLLEEKSCTEKDEINYFLLIKANI